MAKFQLETSAFKSWLDVYKSVEESGLLNEKIIDFLDEDGNKLSELSLCNIKSNAFDEIYKTLPGNGTASLVGEMLLNEKELTDMEKKKITFFLKRLPTRLN